MNKKQALTGAMMMLMLCFQVGTSWAFLPELNPVPIPNPNPPDISFPPSGERNVLLIVADDMGIDLSKQYIPVTGNSPVGMPATPTIRRLWKSGIIFHNAWANPVCSPTRAGFLTGRHAFRTGVTNAIGAPGSSDLPDAELTLPALIASAGYVSGLFGKWHLGDDLPSANDPNDGPLEQGFDHHEGVISGALSAYDSWEKFENGASVGIVTQYATEANVQDAFDWIQVQNSRWFAVVAFNAPHTPLHEPTMNCDGVVAGASGNINAMIECMDFHIDWLLSQLSSIGALEETTIIFIGDNGTDSASIQTPFSSSGNPSHKMEVYEGGIRVPFVISDGYHLEHGAPAPSSSGLGYISSPGRRDYNTMVHTVDIFATVAGIAGVASTADDSVSILPRLAGNFPVIPRQYMYTDRCHSNGLAPMFQAAIRDSQYKLIYRLDLTAAVLSPVLELYDVSDLDEMPADNLIGTGIPNEALLLAEMNGMWASEGYNPVATAGCP